MVAGVRNAPNPPVLVLPCRFELIREVALDLASSIPGTELDRTSAGPLRGIGGRLIDIATTALRKHEGFRSFDVGSIPIARSTTPQNSR
jgi:hypothetical protein